jgi:hypothetical protein
MVKVSAHVPHQERSASRTPPATNIFWRFAIHISRGVEAPIIGLRDSA